MRTRRAGKAGALPAAEPEEARPAVRGAIGGVRKKRGAAGGKAAAVLTKRVTLRGRTVSSREGRPAQPSASQEQPGPGSSNSAPAGQQQQQQQAGQQAAAAAGRQQVAAAARKRRGQLAAAKSSAPNIEGLTTEALQEIFLHLRKEDGEQQSYCRETLPLVCKRFRDVLREPSAVWETLHVDFIQKDQALLFPELFDESGTEPLTWGLDGTCRRLLHTAVERWTAPRAAAVKRLVLSFSARDQTHSFPKTGRGLRPLFSLLGPTLQELYIAHCSDIFHAASFKDLPMLPNLESVAVTFMTGKVPAADLAPLEQLPRLRSLTLSASRSAEEGGEHCLDAFPDMLTRLKGLTSLALCSQGIAVLPGHITKLRSLASLDVSGCPLSFLPAVLWRLAALRRVRLNATHLAVSLAHTWEPLTKLPALESIELRDCNAPSLPPALTGLHALTSLDLSDNSFEVVGWQEEGLHALVGLPKLQRLLLRCCQLPSVPPEVGAISRLTHLDLSRNQLVELPPSMNGLASLRELVAEGNCFPRIPQVLAELPALEVADLSFNIYMEAAASLQPLVGEGGLSRLRRLDLRKMLGAWKQSSIRWLRGLVQELEQQRAASGGARPVVLWD